ncbi:nitrite reductase [bacterium]|nr:nitrite reductase [bacterium]
MNRGSFVILFTILVVLIVGLVGYALWPAILNGMLPADSRPASIDFAHETVSDDEFDEIAKTLLEKYPERFDHIDRYRRAGIRSYEGPETCLQCHATIQIEDAKTGGIKDVNLMENLLGSVHYKFFSESHPNVWGFNGEKADNFPMGKLDRPCPKPGSFAFTAWAELVVLDNGDTLSEGCGQCHIGGQYQAPLGEILPGYRTTEAEKQAIDCLICHSAAYDMNAKEVVEDLNGRKRWTQDRSMLAAMSIVTPTSKTCLRCHQHNFGGDIYVDSLDSFFMQSQWNVGMDRPRIMHPGSKRGTPYSPSWDVHAAQDMSCIECHQTEGHLIAKGTHTTTMMANDLPEVEVSCEKCHTAEPHSADPMLADFYNMHTETVACVTCHIPVLHEDNATRRDFNHPEFEEHEGIYVYDDKEKYTDPKKGIMYVWWNGDATFLGNPIGANPNGEGLYRFYDPDYVWPEFEDFDYEQWYDETMRPIAENGRPSKLYAMKRFNGRQHIDLQNIGPFGGMYVPYNLPAYYTTGDPDLAAKKEVEKPMMGMMYGPMFKYYLMDKFMSFMMVDGWDMGAYEDVLAGEKVEPRWIPMDASLEISHGIRLEGALTCGECHAPDGVLDWEKLGYTEDEIALYSENPLE